MLIEKKIIVGCIFALAIGALAISPLMLSILKTTRAETTSPTHFGINIPYAYIRFTNSNNSEEIGREFFIAFNATNSADLDNVLPDAAIEYFQVQVYSDKGPIANITEYVGVAYNNSFTQQIFHSFIFSRDQYFDTRSIGGGIFMFNWTTNQSHIYSISGSTNFQPNYQEAKTLFMNVSRIGSVVFKGNSTIVSISTAEFIEHLQLEKYENGFLLNTIVPSDQLSLMDPLKPNLGNLP